MKRPLWPHQEDAIRACLGALGNRPGYVQMPTGSGKGEVIRQVALAWLAQSSAHRVIIGVPNHTLAFQQRAVFALYGCDGHIPTLYMEGFRFARASRLVIATYMSLCGVPLSELWRYIKRSLILFIADECHHFNLRASANMNLAFHFKNRIGFFASPWSEGCPEQFDSNLLYGLSLTQAQQAGALCPFVVEFQREMQLTHGQWALYFVRNGSRFNELKSRDTVFFDLENKGRRRKLNDAIIDRFRSGEIRCIYANRMLLEGFDCRECKTIYIEKITDSLIMTYQMSGRGMRKMRDQNCRIIVDNVETLKTLKAALRRANNA